MEESHRSVLHTVDELRESIKRSSSSSQIIQAQQEIIERERELETARRRLEQIRIAKYKDRPAVDYESGSDF